MNPARIFFSSICDLKDESDLFILESRIALMMGCSDCAAGRLLLDYLDMMCAVFMNAGNNLGHSLISGDEEY